MQPEVSAGIIDELKKKQENKAQTLPVQTLLQMIVTKWMLEASYLLSPTAGFVYLRHVGLLTQLLYSNRSASLRSDAQIAIGPATM